MKSQNNFKKLSVTLLLLAMLALPAMAMAATISTDQEDYAPWEIVTINGSGFDPASDITLTMEWPDGYVDKFYGTADDSGGFTLTYGKEKMEGTFTVTATDSDGQTAQTTFTDATTRPLQFRETGLPSETLWQVTVTELSPSTKTSTTNTIAWGNVTPGSYSYTVGIISGYVASPSSGTVTVPSGSAPFIVSITFSVAEVPDTGPPETVIISGPLGWISTNTATFTWTGSDDKTPTADLVYSYKLDNGSWSDYSLATTVTLTGLSEGSHTFQVKAKDKAGKEDPTPASRTFGVDLTGPVIVPTIDPSPNTAGWNNTTVTVTWTVTDPESGIASSSGAEPTTLTSETTYEGTTLTCTATNNAGLTNSVSVIIKIDKTPPVVTATADPPANSAGWNNTNVTVTFSATDALSGVVAVTPDVTVTTEGAGKVVTGSAIDLADNVGTASVTLNIDKTPPVITITTPADGAEYLLNQVVPADWSAIDALSGVTSSSGTVPSGSPIATSTVGTKTFTVTATDKAGNPATQTVTYFVHYGFIGLLPPYQAPPKAFKITSSIPLKWQYTDYSGTVVDSSAANPFVQIKMVLAGGTSEGDPITLNDPGSSGLRYDSLSMTWQYNWQTKGLTAGIYNIRITSSQSGQTNGPFPIQLR